LAKHEKLASNSLAKQLDINSNLASLLSARAYPRRIGFVKKELEEHKSNFVSISGFLM
jgi:hypothetical protein